MKGDAGYNIWLRPGPSVPDSGQGFLVLRDRRETLELGNRSAEARGSGARSTLGADWWRSGHHSVEVRRQRMVGRSCPGNGGGFWFVFVGNKALSASQLINLPKETDR